MHISNHLTISIDYLVNKVSIGNVGDILYIANEPMPIGWIRIKSRFHGTAVYQIAWEFQTISIIIESQCIMWPNIGGALATCLIRIDFQLLFRRCCKLNMDDSVVLCTHMLSLNLHLIYAQFNGIQFQITTMLTALCGDNTPKIYLVCNKKPSENPLIPILLRI